MKKLYIIIGALLVTCLTACVDVDETYDFHADGSCNVTYNFDMSKAVSVLVNLLPDSVRQTPQFNMVQDTTVNYYNILADSVHRRMDSIQVSTARSSDVVMMLNLKKNLVRISLRHSSDNVADLNYYLKNLSKMTSNDQLGALLKSKKAVSQGADKNPFALTQDYYNYEITTHKFYRTIDMVKFKKYVKVNQSTFTMSKAMLIEMPYKVTVNLPYPISKIDNKKATLSADKKSITIETNIDEVLKDPDVMNFKIDF
ncbi:hypothetical protein BDD43_3438 [Mucilaginibacter gracilis]|uniref:Uncharacterized protein n=1 Tax=Mucilaginibacter gracilis TaxID=423350 RepID=A0A495J2M9_9SPHI|nr:hypothetical protein [Mucilaginibacter gracilis]RKR83235.1 hypothetical protein BDD43_3438 [Mucilaginibacter gracilis]